MTFKEAFIQAMREQGDTDEQIQRTLAQMEQLMPMPERGDIPAGMERDFIERVKKVRSDFLKDFHRNPIRTTTELLNDLKKHNTNN